MKVKRQASDLKLKVIGKRNRHQASQADSPHGSYLHMQNSFMQDQQVPLLGDEFYSEETPSYKYSVIEDTRVSRFTHNKIILVEKHLLILTVLIFFLGITKAETDVAYQEKNQISSKIMNILSFAHLILLLLLLHRKVLFLQLEMDQHKMYIRKKDRRHSLATLTHLFHQPQYLLQLLLQFILVIPHPNILLQGKFFTVYYEGTIDAKLYFSYNDILSVLMIIKVYIILRSMVQLTPYSAPRAVRLCQVNSFQHSKFYSIKCMQREYPLFCTTIQLWIFTMIFSYSFRISQGNLYAFNHAHGITLKKQVRSFEGFWNCIWFTFTTMMTIGYGEMYPIAGLSRFLTALVAIIGVILNSFLVVALTQYLKCKVSQIRSHTTLTRLKMWVKLEAQGADLIGETVRIRNHLAPNNLDPLILKSLRPIFENLKEKIDNTKTYHKKIKSILPTNNNSEEMIRQFEIIKDNFREFYVRQRRIKDKIEKMEREQEGQLGAVRANFLLQVTAFAHTQ